MTDAEAMRILEGIRGEEERSYTYAYELSYSSDRKYVTERYDQRLTALAMALDALRRSKHGKDEAIRILEAGVTAGCSCGCGSVLPASIKSALNALRSDL